MTGGYTDTPYVNACLQMNFSLLVFIGQVASLWCVSYACINISVWQDIYLRQSIPFTLLWAPMPCITIWSISLGTLPLFMMLYGKQNWKKYTFEPADSPIKELQGMFFCAIFSRDLEYHDSTASSPFQHVFISFIPYSVLMSKMVTPLGSDNHGSPGIHFCYLHPEHSFTDMTCLIVCIPFIYGNICNHAICSILYDNIYLLIVDQNSYKVILWFVVSNCLPLAFWI